MSTLQRIVITSPLTANQFKSVCDFAPGQLPALQNLENYLVALSGGNERASLAIKVAAVQAAATLTVESTGSSNDETCIICNITFTAKTSGASGNQFNISSTPGTQASNMAAAFNASSDLTGKVTAAAVAGVVTITAVVPGLMGNGLQISEGLTNVALSAFAGGTDGTAYALDFS
jgi:hypothetical protein